MSTAFWNSKEGTGSWEASESCQLDSGSSIFPIKHLRISEAVIALSASHRGGAMAAWLYKKWSQLEWHSEPAVGQFVPRLPGRETHTPV